MDSNSNHSKNDNTSKKHMEMSVKFNYILTKSLDGLLKGGTTSWWGMRVLKIYGGVPEELCPTNTKTPDEEWKNTPISIEAFLTAKNMRSDYYQRLYTIEDCMRAIITCKGITMSLDTFSSIKKAEKGYITIPKIGEEYLGAHSVYVYGYSQAERHFNFVNSWGAEWGDRGYGYLPFDYFDNDLILEAWGTVVSLGTKKTEEQIFTRNLKNGQVINFKQSIHPSIRGDGKSMCVLDIYKNNLIIGLAHFSAVNKEDIELEEFYILPAFQNMGIGTEVIKLMQQIIKKGRFKKIIGWVSAQDLVAGREEQVIAFLKKNKFNISEDSSRFRGAVYRIEKKI